MQHLEALDFLNPAQIKVGEHWADLGAGSGTFSRALAELLGPEGFVYAIDKDVPSLHEVQSLEKAARIEFQAGDFTQALDLPLLDGILMANSLHYVRKPIPVLKKILKHLSPSGTFLLIEYDRKMGNPWVPYPISTHKWKRLAIQVGLSEPTVLESRPSRYGQGTMFLAQSYWGE